MLHGARNEKSGDSLAMDISALAISGGSSLSERTKLDRDLFVEGFGRGKKNVLADGSVGLKDVEEAMDSSPPEDWRSWMTGGRSLSLFGDVVGRVGDVEVVAVVVAVVVGGEVICLSSSSSSLALVVVTMVWVGRSDRLQSCQARPWTETRRRPSSLRKPLSLPQRCPPTPQQQRRRVSKLQLRRSIVPK